MTGPGPLEEEAALLAAAVLDWVRRAAAGRLPEPPPDAALRLTQAVTDFAVAGAALARVLTELAAAAASAAGSAEAPAGPGTDDPDGAPRVQHIDIG